MRDINEILAKKTVALQPSGIRKFFDIVRTMEGAISLGVGEPDFDTPWPIRELLGARPHFLHEQCGSQ